MQRFLGKERAKRWAELSTPKGRREAGYIRLDSVGLVEAGLDAGLIEELAVRPGEHRELVERWEDMGRLALEADDTILKKIAAVETSPGIVAVARFPRAAQSGDFNKRSFMAVYLDHIADPGNLGTIARSAAAFGATALIVSEGSADPFSPKALRASAGALLRLPVLRRGDETPAFLTDAVHYRAVVRGGQSIGAVKWAARRVLWLGNEAHGVGDGKKDCPVVDVTIPMAHGTESLNVAGAAAILLYAMSEMAANANRRG